MGEVMNVDTSEETDAILSICAGGGGLDLGVELALRSLGRRSIPITYVEREAYAAEILASRMDQELLGAAPIHTDVTQFDGRPFSGLVDGIVGGYPCQPFSLAGKRLGADDPRHLWPYIRRLIDQIYPRWCFFENVRGHLSLGAHDVIRDLQGLGYRVAAGLYEASEVGAPHKRERLFILAYADCEWERQLQRGQSVARRRTGHESQDVVHADSSGLEGRLRPQPQGSDIQMPPWPPGPEDTSGWVEYLKRAPGTEPALCRTAHGMAGRVDRLRMLGNGVVPQQAAFAFLDLLRQLCAT